MIQVELTDAKDRLAELMDRARSGEEIVLTEGGKSVVSLAPAEDCSRRKGLGIFKGQVWISDDFNAPLSDEELKEWGM